MNTSTAITPRQELTPAVWEMITSIAPTVHQSRLFAGINSPEQAAVVMLKGLELGFNLTASFEYIEMISSKASLKPQGALALIHRSRNFDLKVSDGQDYCEVWMRRRDTGFEYTSRFGLAEAQQAGLVKKDGGYDKYPADMFRARAIARCARVVAPDVLAGLYLTTELQIDDTGVPVDDDIIEVEAVS
jgi:hypothetical protein